MANGNLSCWDPEEKYLLSKHNHISMKTHKLFPIKTFILTGSLLILTLFIFGQTDYNTFCRQSIRSNNAGMLVLGGWAVANIASGAYGWSQYSNERKYFNQMNLFWNVVNLSIASIALYNNYHLDCYALSSEEIFDSQARTEKILLINSALDLGYIGTGFLLRHLSINSAKKGSLLKGYGNSLLLQGSFLLVFDLMLYQILRNQRIDFLNSLNLTVYPDITGFQILLNI